MNYQLDKFYRKREDGSLELRESYLLAYSFRRGHQSSEERCPIVEYFIDKELKFEAFFIWAKFPSTDFIESHIEGELPSGINKLLQKLNASPKFEMKESYTDSTAVYVPDGARLEGMTIHHKDEVHSLNLSPYYFREKFMETPQEKIILKLYLEIDAWLIDEFNEVKVKWA